MVSNPIGVAAVQDPEESTVGVVLLNLLLLLVVAAFVSLVIRFRRSRGEERQQLKWFTYAGALVPWLRSATSYRSRSATCSSRPCSRCCRSPGGGSRSCATGCTTSTG